MLFPWKAAKVPKFPHPVTFPSVIVGLSKGTTSDVAGQAPGFKEVHDDIWPTFPVLCEQFYPGLSIWRTNWQGLFLRCEGNEKVH